MDPSVPGLFNAISRDNSRRLVTDTAKRYVLKFSILDLGWVMSAMWMHREFGSE